MMYSPPKKGTSVSRIRKPLARVLLPGVLTCLAALLTLKYPPVEASVFIFPLLLFSVYFIYVALRFRVLRVIAFNLGALALVILLFELVMLRIERREEAFNARYRFENVYESVDDHYLGWRLIPNTVRHARKYFDGELLYDITITIDSNHFRITPECDSSVRASVLVFGGSFSYGEGVNDEESMPYLLGEALKDKFKVYNLAVCGYGAHQMLSMAEHGILDTVVEQDARYIIYQGLYPNHAHRAAGYMYWNAHSPRYELDRQGAPVFSGHFNDQPPPKWKWWLLQSAAGRKMSDFRNITWKRDKERYFAILFRSHELLLKKYPGAEFHIIVWDWSHGQDDEWFDELEVAGIRVHQIRDMLPQGLKDNTTYRLHERDPHPNAATQAFLSRWVLDRIIHTGTDGPATHPDEPRDLTKSASSGP